MGGACACCVVSRLTFPVARTGLIGFFPHIGQIDGDLDLLNIILVVVICCTGSVAKIFPRKHTLDCSHHPVLTRQHDL